MLDLDTNLVPGMSAAGIALGQPTLSVLGQAIPEAVEQRIGCRVLKYGPVWVFEDASGIVFQVCVWAGYRGKIAGSVGIGSRITEVETNCGPLEHIEKLEYQVELNSDWCFEVEENGPSMGELRWSDARLRCICIMSRT